MRCRKTEHSETHAYCIIRNNQGHILMKKNVRKGSRSSDVTKTIPNEILKRTHSYFEEVWESSADGMRMVDEQGMVILVNDAYCRLVGKSAEEAIGRHFSEIYAVRERDSMTRKHKKRFTSKTIQRSFERELELWNGEKKWFELSNSYIEPPGEPLLLLSIFRDITFRKELERKLRVFEHTIRSVHESVNITDLDEHIIFVNKAFCDLYGYQEEEILDKSASILRSQKNSADIVENILPSTMHGGWSGEIFNSRKDGTDFLIRLSTSVIRDENDRPFAYIGISRDITEEKRIEENLRLAKKMESMGVLVGGIAHNFNNILNVIVGYASLSEMDQSDRMQIQRYQSAILEASERGANIVQHLMTFIKQAPVRIEDIKIDAALERLIVTAREILPESIRIDHELSAETALVRADRSQFKQAILNILLNAKDAMPRGGTISIQTHLKHGTSIRKEFPKAQEAFYVHIQIEDTGVGIPPENLNRVFEPFFTTKPIDKGIGLGLPMVYGMIDLAGGFIDIESEVSKGTRVGLYFPVRL